MPLFGVFLFCPRNAPHQLPLLWLKAQHRPHRVPLIHPVPLIKITVQHFQPTDQPLQAAEEQLHTGRELPLQRAWTRVCVCVCVCVSVFVREGVLVVVVVEIKFKKRRNLVISEHQHPLRTDRLLQRYVGL